MFDKFSPILDSLQFAYKGPYSLSIGETECIFSPQDRHMSRINVNDCYVMADTIRFFSENNGAFCL